MDDFNAVSELSGLITNDIIDPEEGSIFINEIKDKVEQEGLESAESFLEELIMD